jgi:ribosomal protein S18 acetylase RimI-like enzyme
MRDVRLDEKDRVIFESSANPDIMRIEPAKEQHLADIVRINKALDISRTRTWSSECWIEPRLGKFYLAKDGDDICGAICIDLDGDTAEIETLAVSEESRGRGIGKMLVDFCISAASENGNKRVHVSSYDIYGAKPFYERCGFSAKTYGKGRYALHSFTMKLRK